MPTSPDRNANCCAGSASNAQRALRLPSSLLLLLAVLAACSDGRSESGAAQAAIIAAAANGPEAMRETIRIEDHFNGDALRLAQAAGRGDADEVRRLVERGADPNAVSAQGMPLIVWPLHAQNLAGVRALLDNGADPNLSATDNSGRSSSGPAIVWAARMPDAAYLAAFLDRGGNPNAVSSDGEPLIHVAKLANNWDGLKLLVERGADVDAVDSGGSTVLAFYAGIGARERAHWLIEHGADPAVRLTAAAKPERIGAQPILEDLYWRPTDPKRYSDPKYAEEDRRLWRLLRAKGHAPPPEPERWRKLREELGLAKPDFAALD